MASSDQVTSFLVYGYGAAKDQAITLLTLYAGTLAFVAAFADKIFKFQEGSRPTSRTVRLVLVTLLMAVLTDLYALWLLGEAVSNLRPWRSPPPTQADIDAAADALTWPRIFLELSVFFYFLELICLFRSVLDATGGERALKLRIKVRELERKAARQRAREARRGRHWWL